MQQVDNLSNEANQVTKVVLEDRSVAVITLRYTPATQRWQADVSHPDLEIKGINLCNHPNVLRQFKNNIRFGLACLAADGVDPVYVDDFLNGRVRLFILDAEDVLGIEQNVMAAPA